MSIAKSITILSVFWVIFFALTLGNRPFATPDEGRYVEIPREMVVSGEYVTPRLNGVKYFEKPPLFYWLQAFTIKIFGIREWANRIWVAFFAILGCLATFYFTWATSNGSTNIPIYSSVILSTSVLYYALGHLIILDMPVTVFITIAMFCFYLGINSPPSTSVSGNTDYANKFNVQLQGCTNRRLWFYGFAISCGLGVLTKGIIILVVTGPIILLWLTICKKWHLLKPLYLPSSLLIFLLIALPWHIMVAIKNPDFLHKYFFVEHWLRYTTTIHMRYQPWWFFLPVLAIGFLPWSLLLPQSFKILWSKRSEPLIIFLLLWVSWVVLFFSISNSKLIPYILPVFAPLAILLGHAADKTYYHNYITRVLSVLALGTFLAPNFVTELLTEKLVVLPYIYTLSGIFIITIIFIAFNVKYGLLASAILINVMVSITAPYLQKPSIKEVAKHLNTVKQPNHRIVTYRSYFQDLPVYTQQIITLVDIGGELEFGIKAEDTSNWVWDDEKFIQALKSETMWIVARINDYKDFIKKHPDLLLYKYYQEQDFVIFTNLQLPDRKL